MASQPQHSVSTGKVASGALTTGSAKSLWLLNPATNGLVIAELWLSCGSNASQADVAFELYRTTTLGSPAGTTGTVRQDDPTTAAPTTTALTGLTTEPTAVATLREMYFPLNQGLLIVPWPLGREPVAAPAGARVGLRIVNDGVATLTTVNLRSTVVFDE